MSTSRYSDSCPCPRGLLLLLLLLPLVLGACVERLVDFNVKRLEGVRVTRIDGQGFDLIARYEVENPNPLGATISKVRFETFMGQHQLGRGQMAGPLQVAAKSRFSLEAPVRVTYGRLPPDLPQRVADGTMRIRTVASMTAGSKLGSITMNLTSEDRAKIDDSLKVAIRGSFSGDALKILSINLGRLKLRKVQLKIKIRAQNLFAFPVRIRRGNYSISINGSHFGKGAFSEPLTLAPRGAVERTMEIAASHGAVGSAIMAMMGAEPRFKLKGTLWIDPIAGVSKLPLEVEADSSIFGAQ